MSATIYGLEAARHRQGAAIGWYHASGVLAHYLGRRTTRAQRCAGRDALKLGGREQVRLSRSLVNRTSMTWQPSPEAHKIARRRSKRRSGPFWDQGNIPAPVRRPVAVLVRTARCTRGFHRQAVCEAPAPPAS